MEGRAVTTFGEWTVVEGEHTPEAVADTWSDWLCLQRHTST